MSISRKTRNGFAGIILIVGGLTSAVRADNWNAYLTVDNQFDVYFGTPMATNFYAGGGANWTTTFNFTATGRPPTDYLYVATSSDQAVAQGFIGIFTNTTTSTSIVTGSSVWQVFPAGKYLQQIFGVSGPWTPMLMPTQSQVDAAIAYATTNNLWVAPSTAPGYDNDPSTPTTPYFYPWTYHGTIPASAQWIWYDSGKNPLGNGAMPSPLAGFNHDEFLVFRVPGVAPEPASLLLLAVSGIAVFRKRNAVA